MPGKSCNAGRSFRCRQTVYDCEQWLQCRNQDGTILEAATCQQWRRVLRVERAHPIANVRESAAGAIAVIGS